MTVQWLAVRCCCKPTKVLGFLRVPSGAVRDGMVRFPALQASSRSDDDTLPPGPQISFVTAKVRHVHELGVGNELAIYSEDRPVEFWRNVPSFVEAAGCATDGN